MELHITCIPGDGIGPEIVRETKKVLDKVAHKYGHKMIYKDILMGGASIDVHGVPLTEEAIAYAKAADAVLMGSDVYKRQVKERMGEAGEEPGRYQEHDQSSRRYLRCRSQEGENLRTGSSCTGHHSDWYR